MKTYSLTFSGGDSKVLPSGNLLYVMETTAPIDIELLGKGLNKLNESAEDVEAGYYCEPQGGFNKVTIKSATAQTIKIGITRGNGGYNRSVGEVAVTPSTTITSTADATVNATTAQVLAANSSRKEAIISNLAGNPNAIRVGDSNTGASRGVEVPVGGSIVVSTRAAIYVYSAGSSSIGLLEVED